MGLCSVSVGREGPQHAMAETVVWGPDPCVAYIQPRPPAFNSGVSLLRLSGSQEGCTVCRSLTRQIWGVCMIGVDKHRTIPP